MSNVLNGASLRQVGSLRDTNIYALAGGGFYNRYYVLSSPQSRRLLCSPEVIGYDCPLAILPSTIDAFSYLQLSDKESVFDILTILRGGLNYPLEEAAYHCALTLGDMHFLSCERIIEDKVIKGLEIKYEKMRPTRGHTLLIGDILATGDTFALCMDHFMQRMASLGGSIRRIIFFTIGGTRAITLLEDRAQSYRRLFPEFEGFDCFFYEGIFTVYDSKGVSGINVPDIDFGCKGGAMAPQMRRALAEDPVHLLEKCIIYDGGARRYEIAVHCDEVLEYWEGMLERSEGMDVRALMGEKLGYDAPLPYADWLRAVHLDDAEGLQSLWETESELLSRAGDIALGDIARERINTIKSIKQRYE